MSQALRIKYQDRLCHVDATGLASLCMSEMSVIKIKYAHRRNAYGEESRTLDSAAVRDHVRSVMTVPSR